MSLFAFTHSVFQTMDDDTGVWLCVVCCFCAVFALPFLVRIIAHIVGVVGVIPVVVGELLCVAVGVYYTCRRPPVDPPFVPVLIQLAVYAPIEPEPEP